MKIHICILQQMRWVCFIFHNFDDNRELCKHYVYVYVYVYVYFYFPITNKKKPLN